MVKQRLHKCKPSSQLITSSDYSLTFFFRSMARNVESLTWLLGIFAAKIQISHFHDMKYHIVLNA